MSNPDKKKDRLLTWLVLPVTLFSAGLGNVVGDLLFICLIYGPHAYFDENLRIEKHKPYTLSTGVVLSDNLNFLGFLIDVILWLGFTILFMYILAGLFSAFRRMKERSVNEVA